VSYRLEDAWQLPLHDGRAELNLPQQ